MSAWEILGAVVCGIAYGLTFWAVDAWVFTASDDPAIAAGVACTFGLVYGIWSERRRRLPERER